MIPEAIATFGILWFAGSISIMLYALAYALRYPESLDAQ